MSATHPILLFHVSDLETPLAHRLQLMLGQLEFEIVCTDELLSAASEHKPDAIITEWSDEIRKNIETLKRDEFLYRIPVFTVADDPDLEDVARMITAGAEDCIQPSTPDILIKSRLCNALKTKFYYDYVLRVAEDNALRDPLTDLWNHRQFHELLHMEVSKHERAKSQLSLMMVDLDRFKRINDTYGHPVGDQVIKETAAILRAVLRPGDVVARYGGEEFGVILPGADRAQGLAVAERLREAIAKAGVTAHAQRLFFTSSIGIATFPDDATESSELIRLADMALLQAKLRGRNRVESVRPIDFEYRTSKKVAFLGIGGNWNAWSPEHSPLELVSQGESECVWRGKLILPTGKNKYKFMARFTEDDDDRLWFPDGENPAREPDGFGGYNSIVTVDEYELRQ